MTIWLAKKEWLREYGAHRLRVLSGEYSQKYEAGLFDQLKAQREPILSIDGNKATIKITGPTTEAGPDFWDLLFGYGGVAYSEIQEALLDADAKLDADGDIKMLVNTPGGEASGVEFTHDVVKDVASRRTVTTQAVSLMASAGIWYTAPSTRIESEGKSTIIGSVGVATQVTDWSEYYESHGVYVHNLTNTESPDKRPDMSTEKGRGVIVEELNQIYKVFIESVVEGRGDATTKEKIESLRGAVVTGEKALEIGFVDAISNNIDKSDSNKVQKKNSPPQKAAGIEKGKTMDLNEFLSTNPAAKREVDAMIADAKAEGKTEARDAIKKAADVVLPIVKSDAYPAKFTEAGIGVLAGTRSLQSFEDFVALFDMDKEGDKSAKAKEEADKVEPTPSVDPAEAQGEEKQKTLDARFAKIKAMNP
jgi:ClpP class serine protease